MKKYLAAAGIASVVGVTGVVGASIVSAATNPGAGMDRTSSLIDALSSKFNLNKSEVQSVFDEQRTKMQAEREAEVKDAVAQLVTDGKLTQDQADKINAKRAEIQKDRQAIRDATGSKTRAEMRTEMQAMRTELEAWAKQNGIATEYLRYVIGGGYGHDHMGGMMGGAGATSN